MGFVQRTVCSTEGHDAHSGTFTKLKWEVTQLMFQFFSPWHMETRRQGGVKGLMHVHERAGNVRTEVTPNKHSLLAT